MVDEYLSEREQADQLRQWLRENWIWLVAGVALALGGWYGWRWWQAREASRSLDAGQQLAAMLDALGRNEREKGMTIGEEIAATYPDTPYATHAGLVLARLDVESGDLAGAESRLARIASDADDPDIRLVASLRLARVQLAAGRYDSALATLDAVKEPSVAARVHELRGDVKLAQGDPAGALESWRSAQAAGSADPSARQVVDAELLQLKIDQAAASARTE
jgi:predicted negative regulator of RcsB-dependent stress response